MSIQYCIVISFAIQSVTLAAEPCCFPLKFEGYYQQIVFGNNPGTVVEAKLNRSIDYVGKMEAISVLYYSVDGKSSPPFFKLIDYLNGIEYNVQDNMCKKNTFTSPMESNCLPDGPTQVIKAHFGAYNEMLPLNQYVYTHPSSNVTQTVLVTEQNCYLVLYTETMGDGRTSTQTLISGMSVGIKNPDIFNVPDVCKQTVPHGKILSEDFRMRPITWFK